MPVEIGHRERECVVDADEGGDVAVEFLTEPFGKTPPRPIPPWTGRRLNGFRSAGALGNIHTEPLATGVRPFRAGVVDADVALELRQQLLLLGLSLPNSASQIAAQSLYCEPMRAGVGDCSVFGSTCPHGADLTWESTRKRKNRTNDEYGTAEPRNAPSQNPADTSAPCSQVEFLV
jgi:hypothetical protein